jgi:uncharacterized membrane protein
MKQISIRQSLKVGWSLFMRRPWYLLGLTLAVCGLFMATMAQGALATALSYVVYGGYLALLVSHFKGDSISFDDLFDIEQKRWISFAFLAIIKGLLILLGLLCFVIPGVYLIVRWMFAELYVVDKGMRPMEALKASSTLTEGVRLKLFLFVLTATVCMILGLVFFLVGAVVVFIITTFATIKIYKDLQEEIVTLDADALV